MGSIASNSFPEVLTIEEEKKYLNLLKEGSDEARTILIEHNLRLVAHIANKFDNTREDKDDLLSIGSIGLIKAVDTYNFESNTRLATYASRCIENEILMYLRSSKRKRETTWLFEPIGTDKEGNEIRLIDIIEDPGENPYEKLVRDETEKIITEALQVLSAREYEIINYRYGLDDTLPMTQKEIARILKISRSYVSRIEKRALTKLYLEIKKK